MRIEKDTVVSLDYKLYDMKGNVVEESSEPLSYLHGGYDSIFPAVEERLNHKDVGYSCSVVMEPEDSFGDYDAELVLLESRDLFPENVEVGMQFEGPREGSDETIVYTVTDIADDKVVVDGNHPLAGVALRFDCTVKDVRPATRDEVLHGHAHGPDGHGHEH
jgi:FKBP-type peptidyl-prolyl cis-trans isomerase SlyD